MTGHYHETIDILYFIKRKLQSHPYMYKWALDDDIIMVTRQQGMLYDTVTKSFIVSYVVIHCETSIEEVQLEYRA